MEISWLPITYLFSVGNGFSVDIFEKETTYLSTFVKLYIGIALIFFYKEASQKITVYFQGMFSCFGQV